MKKITLIALSVAIVAGCAKNLVEPVAQEPAGKQVNISFEVAIPNVSPDSKVALGSDGLSWTGNETAKIILGKTANNMDNPVIQSTAPGVFGGTVTLPTGFEMTDIIGIVVPGEYDSYFRWHGTKLERRILLNIPSSQTSGETLDMGQYPFFCALSPDMLSSSDGTTWTVPGGVTLYSGADMLKFNIFGKHAAMADGETLESVEIQGSNSSLVSTLEYNVAYTGDIDSSWVVNSGSKTIKIATPHKPVLGGNRDNGAIVYGSVMSCLDSTAVNNVVITTDKATYTKEVAAVFEKKDITQLTVQQIGLDLSTFARESFVSYSVDGGENWLSELPATLDDKLAVKTAKDHLLTAEALTAIKAAVDGATNPVALDLSATQYESDTFPKIFAGTSESKLYTKLKSIKFPSNISIIAENAFLYCDLESVDLTGINFVDRQAFKYSGLKTLSVPSSVDTIGNEAFAYLKKVESVYYNSTMAGAPKAATGFKILCNRSTSWGNKSWNNRNTPVTITIGPDVKEIPPYFFDTNARLTNLIIEAGADLKFSDQWAIRAYNIERIEFKGDAPTCNALGQGGSFANELGAKEGVIVCPVGRYGEFSACAVIKNILSSGKYRLRELGDEDNMVDPIPSLTYSTDNQTWVDEIPETFESLYVRTANYAVTKAELDTIKLKISAQTSPVALDMSAAEYVSITFPAVFKATSGAPNTTLKSVKFPRNVSIIAANAFDYCTKLEEVELTGIERLNISAFRYTALETVSIPSTMTYMATSAFGYIASLKEVYCDASISASTEQYVFSNRSTDYSNSSWNNADSPLKVTFGPNMKVVDYHVFDTNAKLVELVLEGSDVRFYREWAIRCMNLRRIVFKGDILHASSSTDFGISYRAFENVKDGVVVVPDDKYDAFAENKMIKALLGLTYDDGTGNQLPRFTLVKASEDVEVTM